MDFEKLQENVGKLEASLDGLKKGDAGACRTFALGLRDILSSLLKDRRDPIRPGNIFKDAAAKNLVPGDVAAKGDALLLRWAGNVTPKDEQTVKEDAARLVGVAEKTLPVLKSYKKDK